MKLRLVPLILVIFFTMCSNPTPSSMNMSADSIIITYYPDSSINEIAYKQNGTLEGRAVKFDEDGYKLYDFFYENDQRQGPQYIYTHGDLKAIENFENGIKQGRAQYFNPDCGFVVEEGNFIDNRKEDIWIEYFNKEVKRIVRYKDDTVAEILYSNKKYDFTGQNPPPRPLTKDECCCVKLLE